MTDYLEDVDCHYIVPLIRLDISAPNEISRDGVRQKNHGHNGQNRDSRLVKRRT